MDRTHAGTQRYREAVRVRVLLDHWEFARSCKRSLLARDGRHITPREEKSAQSDVADEVRWHKLADAIMDHLDTMDYIADSEKELRAIDVYASVSPNNSDEARGLKNWLRDYLDRLPGFNVHQFDRTYDRPEVCPKCKDRLQPEIEKGLKTKVACDILSWAVEDHYDIAVLVMDDPELIPSIMCVQEVFDKQIVHVGLRSNGEQVRSAAWGHILLEDIFPEIMPQHEPRTMRLRPAR